MPEYKPKGRWYSGGKPVTVFLSCAPHHYISLPNALRKYVKRHLFNEKRAFISPFFMDVKKGGL